MIKIIARLPKKSSRDQKTYIFGSFVALIGALIVSSTKYWAVILGIGFLIIILTFFLAFFRQKLTVDLLVLNGSQLIITPVKRSLFTGWETMNPITIDKESIMTVEAYTFTHQVEMNYQTRFILNNQSIILLQINRLKTQDSIIDFVKNNLSNSKLIINGKLI